VHKIIQDLNITERGKAQLNINEKLHWTQLYTNLWYNLNTLLQDNVENITVNAVTIEGLNLALRKLKKQEWGQMASMWNNISNWEPMSCA
jgi:hypothetical protein